MKKLSRDERNPLKLKLHRETLRQLETFELERANGGVSVPTSCEAGTIDCCRAL
jgi:hypothetical protein